LEIEFGFYSGGNPRSFWKCGGVCECVNRNRGRYCFLFSKGPILNDIRGHSDPKIYARLQEIASNFSKFSGEAPRPPADARAFVARFGASPPYAPLFKISASAPGVCGETLRQGASTGLRHLDVKGWHGNVCPDSGIISVRGDLCAGSLTRRVVVRGTLISVVLHNTRPSYSN